MVSTKEKKELLKDRKAEQKRKPKFKRHAAHRKSRLAENWRRPRGLQNKLRLNKKSRGPRVSTGYRTPARLRGFSRDGMRMLVVHDLKELHAAEPEVHAIVVAAALGNRKRLAILTEAKKHGFTILNHDTDKKVEMITKRLTDRKIGRAERLSKQAERDKSLEKKAKEAKKEEEKSKEEKKDAGEKRKEELKEQQKILTKKE